MKLAKILNGTIKNPHCLQILPLYTCKTKKSGTIVHLRNKKYTLVSAVSTVSWDEKTFFKIVRHSLLLDHLKIEWAYMTVAKEYFQCS